MENICFFDRSQCLPIVCIPLTSSMKLTPPHLIKKYDLSTTKKGVEMTSYGLDEARRRRWTNPLNKQARFCKNIVTWKTRRHDTFVYSNIGWRIFCTEKFGFWPKNQKTRNGNWTKK